MGSRHDGLMEVPGVALRQRMSEFLQLDLTLHSEAVGCRLFVGAEKEKGNCKWGAPKPPDVTDQT